jgi:hypothetical protein
MEQVMSKAVWSGVLTAAAVLLFAGHANAQATDTASVTVSATVNAKAKLTMGSTTASFADADPDVTPLLSASAISVDVKARTTAAGSVTLTVLASDDLSTGSDAIAISNLTWTVTGTNFAAGTMSKTAAQSLGSWTGGGTQSGTQTYKLVNSWSYKTGSYSTTITYTLTAP